MITFMTSGTFWSSALLIIVTTYILTYYLFYHRQVNRWKQSNIPFLQPTFLIGHKHFLSGKYSITAPLDRIYNENKDKDLFGLFLGTMPVILLKEEELICQVLVKNFKSTFTSGFALPESEVEGQYMLLTSSDKHKWKLGRDTLLPIFSFTWLQGSRYKRVKEAIHELWRTVEFAESEGCPMNVTKVTRTAVMSIISSTFGLESHSNGMKDLETISEGINAASLRRFISFGSQLYFPTLQKIEYFKTLPRNIINIMSEILTQEIQRRDRMNTEKDDFIDVLRSIRDAPESHNKWSKKSDLYPMEKGITRREMTGLGLTLVLGGSDTVSNLLDFAIHLLSLYPEYQSRIRKEAHQTMKQHGVSEFTFQVIQDLSFTLHCLQETSRLYPLLPVIMRKCSDDIKIPGANYILRKGDRVAVPLYSFARDERYFRNPHTFDPERFNSENIKLIPPGAFLNFGIGPRKCPGYKQGLTVAAALLASLLLRFEIKPRSHLEQIDATGLHPFSTTLFPRKEILVDILPFKNVDDV